MAVLRKKVKKTVKAPVKIKKKTTVKVAARRAPSRKKPPKQAKAPARKAPPRKVAARKAHPAKPRDLLLEIGTEEIPAGYLPPAIDELQALAAKELAALRLVHGNVTAHATPRRLVLHVQAVAPAQTSSVKEVMGPAKAHAFDAEGKPTRAAEGFARGQGVPVGDLKLVSTPKGEYVAAVKAEPSLPAEKVLPEALVRLVTSLHFPKFQRWGSLSLKFPRPIRWLLCLLGPDVLPLDLEGIRSGRATRGHRFLAPGPFSVKDPADYFKVLRRARVVVDEEERKEIIRLGVAEAAGRLGGKPLPDEELLGTVAHLVEFPVVVTGGFDPRYLALPWEVLLTSMRSHQKYFAVAGHDGKPLPNFITVSNNKVPDPRVVAHGNERVLRARLEDAMFFLAEDLKVPLERRAEQLKTVVFQERLGTSWEKMERFSSLAERLAGRLAPEKKAETVRVARLCKADLVTLMVGEFAELQGSMGREYALREGLPSEVAQGIEDHYLPRQSGGDLPKTVPGALVGLADRLDTLCGCFAIGLVPTGTADPYALRRHALAVTAILQDRGWRVDLKEAVGWSLDLLAPKVGFDRARVSDAVMDFFRGRLLNLLTGRGFRNDLVQAVLSGHGDDPVDALRRVEALSAFSAQPGFIDLMVSVKRVMNIIPEGFSGTVVPGGLGGGCELELWESARSAASQVEGVVEETLTGEGNYGEALAILSRLKGPVDAFFTGVMVMDKDPAVKQNRLALLSQVSALFARLADFRKVVTE